MRAFKIMLSWTAVIAVGYGISVLLWKYCDTVVVSVIFMVLGGLAALGSGSAFQTLRKYDDVQKSFEAEQTPDRGRLSVQKLERRRRNFFKKWLIAILLFMMAVIGGGVLKVQQPIVEKNGQAILSVSCIALLVAITLVVLLMVEFVYFSRVARELPAKLAELKRKNDLLERLSAEHKSEIGNH